MLGNLFAGANEAPGDVFEMNGVRIKEYRGMGSRAVIESSAGRERYLTNGRKAVAEGVEAVVRSRGPLCDVVAELSSGLQVGMGYVGARTLQDLRERAEFIRISAAGVREGEPHSLERIV
jgi:IMP dehydrogenase